MLIGSDDAQTPGLEPDAETGLDHWVQGLYLQTFEQGRFWKRFSQLGRMALGRRACTRPQRVFAITG